MEVIIKENYEEMSKAAANIIAKLIKTKPVRLLTIFFK